MMDRIPRSFQLAGRQWNVKTVTEDAMRAASGADAGESVLGLCVTHDADILLVEGLRGDTMKAVFYHELHHAMFETLGWTKMSKDEGKVDAMGSLLYQYLQTIDY